mmetsp:Transcript_23568/g.33744  ORF Transcript_23568/g.33744 Transcript_23568/m.33744 type:complete len:102 (+) Transcript_23568:116-421(+)
MSGIFSFTSGIFSSGNEKLLIKASKDGNLKEVQRLLDKRVSPNVVDESGCTPLHLAAIKGHQEAVRQLLAGGAQTEAVDTVRRSRRDRFASASEVAVMCME